MAALEDTVDWDSKGISGTPTTDLDLTAIEWTANGEYDSVGGWGGVYDTWLYRRPITINNTSGGVLTDYQVLVELTAGNHTYAHSEAAGTDIRFTRDDGTTALDYWIEEWVEDGTSKIWVEIDSIPENENVCAYIYYGKSGASDESDGDETFLFFDDFAGAVLDTTKWDSAGTVTQDDGVFITGSGAWGNGITTKNAHNREHVFHCSVTPETSNDFRLLLLAYTRFIYFCNDNTVKIYDNNASVAPNVLTWVNLTKYDLKIELLATTGAKFYTKLHSADSWDLEHTSANGTEANTKMMFDVYEGTTIEWNNAFICQYTSTEPTYAVGAEAEGAGGDGFASAWATSAEWTAKGAFDIPLVILGAAIEWDAKGGVVVTAQGAYHSTIEWTAKGSFELPHSYIFIDLR